MMPLARHDGAPFGRKEIPASAGMTVGGRNDEKGGNDEKGRNDEKGGNDAVFRAIAGMTEGAEDRKGRE